MECKLDRISIHYEEVGSGKPVVMIHGYTLDHRIMSGCMEPVFSKRQNYRRIYLDLPGMGKTKGEPFIRNSDQMLQIVCECIEKIIPGENFLIAGESYGGYLTRGVQYLSGERVDGMLLLCPLIIPERMQRDVPAHIVLTEDKELISSLSKEGADEFKSVAVIRSLQVWQRYKEEVYPGVAMADNAFLENLRNEGYAFSFDVDAQSGKFEKPVLFLLGRQDASVGYRDAWNILERYPRATFAVLDKAGHNLQIEQIELFNCLVNEWLDRVEETT